MTIILTIVKDWHTMKYTWKVIYSNSACKSIQKLPQEIAEVIYALIEELKIEGPYRYNWKNYGKLKNEPNRFHCHLNRGRPTYVVCWEIKDKEIKIIEVFYAGTHEKAPY